MLQGLLGSKVSQGHSSSRGVIKYQKYINCNIFWSYQLINFLFLRLCIFGLNITIVLKWGQTAKYSPVYEPE